MTARDPDDRYPSAEVLGSHVDAMLLDREEALPVDLLASVTMEEEAPQRSLAKTDRLVPCDRLHPSRGRRPRGIPSLCEDMRRTIGSAYSTART